MCFYAIKVALHFQILANSNRVKPVKTASKLCLETVEDRLR
jgi:hypothetical protein